MGDILYFDTRALSVDLEQYNRNIQAIKRVPLLAHEIRNPLAILNNFLTLIREKSPSEEIRDYLGRSVAEIKRINNIISTLIREQDGTHEPAKGRGRKFWPLAEEVRNLLEPVGAGRIVINNGADRDLLLDIDADEMKEVLINLVLNAIEAITGNGVIEIGTGFEDIEERDRAVIWVSVDGKGMSQAEIKRIFEPFFSTKTSKERRGLGLAICRDIVDAWGGMITVDSTPEAGSTFRIFLPR
ncbi:MAG TPA: ATP-binding protein [Candidatus Methylomirabilis sp.]|nr:ATP-binding protein [Candidatus Methylomirabilis sp.]